MNVAQHLSSWPTPASAVVVLGDDEVLDRAGVTEAMPWASVTKLLTALTVLCQVGRGDLSLDDAAGPPGATVAHLLSHASGLAPDSATVLAPPGARRIYSNAGFEVLAGLSATRSGQPFEELMRREVLAPLGMDRTRLHGSPAHGAHGPVDDLAALATELMAPTLVSLPLMNRAVQPAFGTLKGVLPGFGPHQDNAWGLGPEVRAAKSPHWTGTLNSAETFGHFGRSGSFLWVDPRAGVGCVGLSAAGFGPWATTAWPQLADNVLRDHAGWPE